MLRLSDMATSPFLLGKEQEIPPVKLLNTSLQKCLFQTDCLVQILWWCEGFTHPVLSLLNCWQTRRGLIISKTFDTYDLKCGWQWERHPRGSWQSCRAMVNIQALEANVSEHATVDGNRTENLCWPRLPTHLDSINTASYSTTQIYILYSSHGG